MRILFLLFLLSGCSSLIKEKAATKVETSTKTEKNTTSPQMVIVNFVSQNHRKIISNLVQDKDETLKSYARVLGVKNSQYFRFKRVLSQNLPTLIQYNEADAFQNRVQKILEDKKVELSFTRPQTQ